MEAAKKAGAKSNMRLCAMYGFVVQSGVSFALMYLAR